MLKDIYEHDTVLKDIYELEHRIYTGIMHKIKTLAEDAGVFLYNPVFLKV